MVILADVELVAGAMQWPNALGLLCVTWVLYAGSKEAGLHDRQHHSPH